jgi:putative transposase
MSHSLTKIWIHAVFGTKDREPLIHQNIEAELHKHIQRHLEDDFGCRLRIINGVVEHIHILFLLNPNYSIKDLLKNIKGESSHWINQQNLLKVKFAWQVGYGAFSVSESNVNDVEQYIRNQKEHHRKKTFLEEYREFMDKHGLTYLPETVQTVSDEME